MRTNVDIDLDLLTRAMQLTGLTTYRKTIHEALAALVQLYEQGEVRDLRGKLHHQAGEPAGPEKR